MAIGFGFIAALGSGGGVNLLVVSGVHIRPKSTESHARPCGGRVEVRSNQMVFSSIMSRSHVWKLVVHMYAVLLRDSDALWLAKLAVG